jgi:zinc protease
MLSLRLCLRALLFATVPFLTSTAGAATPIELKNEKMVLDNGLTLIVHEDHKAPVIAVSVWYHIGSGDEPAGKTGFAHLFEHLMFSGSENHKGTYFAPFEKAGATGLNGTTWFDRTNYFETVPTTAVDMALWMESDRMGHLLGAIGQKELDTQRGVVQNEKRQHENQPYGRVDQNILANIFPANHPYHHDTIGSMKDLNAASLDDVKSWFKANYGAANVTLVLAGDITPAVAKEKVERFFGDIPAGAPVARQQPWTPTLATTARAIQHDHVAQAKIQRQWVAPQLAGPDNLELEIAASILGQGKASRLYQRLVYTDKIADSAAAELDTFALASWFAVEANVAQGTDPSKVDGVISDEIKRFASEGPTDDELARAKVGYRAQFVRQLESVTAQAFTLAEGQVYRGDPNAFEKDLARVASLTKDQVKDAAARWLTKGDYTLTVLPAGEGFDPDEEDAKVAGLAPADGRPAAKMPAAGHYSVAKSDVARSNGVPEVTSFPDLTFPKLERGKLKNGAEVILAERHAIPVTQVQLLFDSGFSADQGRTLGTAGFTAALLNESTKTVDSFEIAKRKERFAAQIGARCDLDFCSARLDALNDQLPASLELFADTVRNPAFKSEDIERVRAIRLAGLAQSKTQPTGIALRILPPLLYGKGNTYGIPFDGFGSEADIKGLRASDFASFANAWIRPDNMKIVVVGDTTLAQILPQLDAAFGDWHAPESAVPKKTLGTVSAEPKPRVYLIDRPDAVQSMILGGLVAPSSKSPDYLELDLANDAFGGSFTSRVNMNLREDKHWAYGANSFLEEALGQRAFLFYAPVQTDKTAESVTEIRKEARAVVSDTPLTEAELAKVKENNVRSLPGAFETGQEVMAAVDNIVKYNRPDDSVQTLKARYEAITPTSAQSALAKVVKPDAITWVVVGDLKKVEQAVRALQIGEVTVLDTDGHPVAKAKK